MNDIGATVTTIEIPQPPCQVLKDSTPIAKLLNEWFTEKDGFKPLKLVDEVGEYDAGGAKYLGRAVIRWIMFDAYKNSLDKKGGSREYFKITRESGLGCRPKDVTEVRGGGEAAVFEDLKVRWGIMRERMAREDGTGKRNFYFGQ